MAHTPGPWTADYGDFAAYCDTGAEVCEVTRGNHDDGSRIPDDEMEANLNLVAAAPDLLAALRVAHDALDYAQAQVDSENDAHRLRQWRVQIGRAIAKAEGKE